MLELGSLREFTFASALLRLLCAMLFGGVIGMERGRKRRPAGFRTYMLVCVGAALTMLLGQYEMILLDQPQWVSAVAASGAKADVSRIGAQVINGIGFLGAGTILVTSHQEVKGLTTAAGLWASACAGLAIGAGFYECVMLALVFIILCTALLPRLEAYLITHARNMNVYVELDNVDSIGLLLQNLKERGLQIFDVDLSSGESKSWKRPNVVLSLRLPPKMEHDLILVQLAQMDCVNFIEEI